MNSRNTKFTKEERSAMDDHDRDFYTRFPDLVLDEEEQQIEDEFDQYVPMAAEKRAKIEETQRIVKMREETEKAMSVLLKEQEVVLEAKSQETGLTYQSLLTDIVHQYFAKRS